MMTNLSKLNSIEVEHYTDSNPFLLRKFRATNMRRGWNKPQNALWTSPIGSTHSWYNWCESEQYSRKPHRVTFTIPLEDNIFVVNSERDALRVHWKPYAPGVTSIMSLDVEYLMNNGYDAVWLTAKGEIKTRFMSPVTFYGWDCETICLLNHKPIALINGEPPVYDEMVREELMEG